MALSKKKAKALLSRKRKPGRPSAALSAKLKAARKLLGVKKPKKSKRKSKRGKRKSRR